MALGERGLLMSVFPRRHPFPFPGLRQKLLVRLYPSVWAFSPSLHPQPCHHPIMLLTFVPPETAGPLGTGSVERHSHSQGGSQIPRR